MNILNVIAGALVGAVWHGYLAELTAKAWALQKAFLWLERKRAMRILSSISIT